MAGSDDIAGHFSRSREALERAAGDKALLGAVAAISARLTEAIRGGNKVLFAGNGGSAADAQHWAGEFVAGSVDRPLPAIALTTDTSY